MGRGVSWTLVSVCVQLCSTAKKNGFLLSFGCFGEAPRILWRPRSGTERLWRCRSVSVAHTCCKGDGSLPDNNWPPTFHDAISQVTLQRARHYLFTPVWREGGGVGGGERREAGLEVSNHDEGLRNTTERRLNASLWYSSAPRPGPLCWAAARWG